MCLSISSTSLASPEHLPAHERHAVHDALGEIFENVVLLTFDDLVQVARDGSDVRGDGQIVIVENDQQLPLEMSGLDRDLPAPARLERAPSPITATAR